MKNKRIILVVISCIIIVLMFGLVACVEKPPSEENPGIGDATKPPTEQLPDGGDSTEPELPIVKKYNVNFYDNDNLLKTYNLDEDTDLFDFVKDMDFEAQKQGYAFDIWYKDIELKNPLDSMTLLTEDTNLYAKFIEVNISTSFSEGFSGTFSLSDSDFVFDEKGAKLTKVYVLNRQFDLLAENILFSLANVYGVSLNNNNDGKEDYFKFNLTYQNENYSYGGNNAVFTKENMIMNVANIANGHTHTSNLVYANCPACYASFYMSTPDLDSAFLTALNFTNAINGGGSWNAETNSFDFSNLQSQNAWQWSYSEGEGFNTTTQAVDYVKGFVSKYKEQFKLELAKIISGNTMITNYGEHLRIIKNSGFTQSQKTLIVNFVKNNIIGYNLITSDNNRKPTNANTANSQSWTAEQHCYKAYNILVPLIVEQAFSQTFENTDVSIYPYNCFKV